ncbi:MAG: transposase [Candidatus Rokubacteria bacterium]|nr:transposase [Candidatus Rokubacteria bacterium]
MASDETRTRRLDHRGSLGVLAHVRRALPFPIRRLQTDRGTEVAFGVVLAVHRAGLAHRYIKPRCPEQNGKVERSHRVDAEEFRGRHDFTDFARAAEALRGWEQGYNSRRFSMALRGLTPAEKLALHLEAA